jgi:plasmid maintenance system antidote protein VapI
MLHRFLKGERDLTLRTAQKLADYFGVELRPKEQ